MRAVSWSLLLGLLSIGAAQQDSTTTSVDDLTNTLDPKPSVRLDPYIRKALLKALSDLEESEKITTVGISDSTAPGVSDSTSYGTTDNEYNSQTTSTETSSKDGIQIHSFIVNGQSAFANLSTNVVPTIIDDKISILSTTAGNVENQVTATLPTQMPFNEIFQTSQSGINLQQVRNIPTDAYIENNLITGKVTTNAPTTTTTPAAPTTPTTTTTTTPKPTHNDDGENIEEVSKKDVQVFQAPLVAAFTVHQDAQGLPKKVVPIYQTLNDKSAVKPLPPLPTNILPPTSIPHLTSSQPDFISQQIALQQQLEEKQRYLEEQFRYLQQQQRQHEELLRKQYYLLQQKEFQRQQQIQQFDQFNQNAQLKRQQGFEQQRLPNQGNNIPFQNLPKDQFKDQNNSIRQNSQISIQQSVALPIAPQPTTNTLTSQQQLPNREAVDFLITLRNNRPEQFPLQENHLPQGISNFLHPGNAPIQSIQQLQHTGLRPLEESFRQQNRVFRQESRVGNLGLNQQYQRFNTYQPIQTNRFFGVRQSQYTPDSELQQLLFETGVNGRNHEDLNIITKVLSLNHGVQLNNNLSNRLPFDNRGKLGRNFN